jgi:uncharacterized membrane protein/thiol-disulfide isomerase/thioredoxin
VKRDSTASSFITILATIATALAAFLLWESSTDAALPGCGPASGCDQVLSSRWSRIGQFPVAALALPIFLIMAILSHWASSYDPRKRSASWKFLPTLAIIASGAALWFLTLQFFLIRQVCIYCTMTHVLALAASFLIFKKWWSNTEPHHRHFAPSLVSALILLALMIGAQIRFPPRLYEIAAAPQDPATQPVQPRQKFSKTRINLFNGQASIEASDWPVFGSRQSPHLIALMFDYTCEHCRREYPLLLQARQRYGDQLGIIAIPLPLEPYCNPTIPRPIPEHLNSCTYVRYALAVFKADPAAFEVYHDRLMDGPKPPPLEEARSIAESLISPSRFAAALRDPYIDGRIEDSVALYRAVGTGPIPKLILPKYMISREIDSAQHLYDVLESHLEIKPLK